MAWPNDLIGRPLPRLTAIIQYADGRVGWEDVLAHAALCLMNQAHGAHNAVLPGPRYDNVSMAWAETRRTTPVAADCLQEMNHGGGGGPLRTARRRKRRGPRSRR
jgi:hypothetical protein